MAIFQRYEGRQALQGEGKSAVGSKRHRHAAREKMEDQRSGAVGCSCICVEARLR